MKKEEFIEQLLEKKANGQKNVMFELCDNTDCNFRCPYSTADLCDNALVDDLLDRIIGLEKSTVESQKAETNLEHYVAYYNNYDQCIYMDTVRLMNEAHRRLNNFEDAIKWLLEPYKPPKPKYKLSKFEYDFLECLKGQKTDQRIYYIFKSMREKGYFKDIPTSVSIKDILDYCEVIDE